MFLQKQTNTLGTMEEDLDEGQTQKGRKGFLCELLQRFACFFIIYSVEINLTWLHDSLAEATVQMLPFPPLFPGERKRGLQLFGVSMLLSSVHVCQWRSGRQRGVS